MTEERAERRTEPEAVAEARASAKKAHSINFGLYIAVITMAACIGTLVVLLWQVNEQRNVNAYYNCLSLYAIGVNEPSCEMYRDYISKNTNVKNPGGTVDGRK